VQANCRAVALGGALGAGLSVGIGAGALTLARSSTAGEGPTAATLDEGFSALLGYEFGIALGLGLMAALARRTGRYDALLAAGIAFACGIPAVVSMSSSDLGPLDYVLILGMLGASTISVGAVAANLGARAGRRLRLIE
jgi:hypothetical protein